MAQSAGVPAKPNEQSIQRILDKLAGVSPADTEGNIQLPAKFTGFPTEDEITQMKFPPAPVINAAGAQEVQVKPLGSLPAPSKQTPEVSTSRESYKPAAEQRQEFKLPKEELDKAITDLGSTNEQTVKTARLKIAEAIRSTNGSDVIKALGQNLENKNQTISKAAAQLLSDTYWGSLPIADGLSLSSDLRYSDSYLLSDVDPRSDIYARLSNPQVLREELSKIAELKRIVGDVGKFAQIKENASAGWLNIPGNAIPGPNKSSRMQALHNLTKTSDFLKKIEAAAPEEFLAKNLHLFKEGSALHMGKFPLSTESLKIIAKQMPDVQALFIENGLGITDEGMKVLQGLKQLDALHMNESKITDAGLATLGRMPQLLYLYLGHTPGITNQGVSNLETSNLIALGFIKNPQITNEAIPAFKNLAYREHLEYLSLINTGVTIPAMQEASNNLGMVNIRVSGSNPPVDWEHKAIVKRGTRFQVD